MPNALRGEVFPVVDPELLAEVPMFHSLPLTELERLAEIMREDVVPDGRVLFDVGDPGASMYIVKSGKIRISIPGDAGEEVPLAHLGPGEFFGELALLDGQPRSARASAVDATDLYVLSRDSFLSFIGSRPDTALAMLSATAKRLRHTDELMRSRASFDVNEELKKTETLSDRISDKIASFGGSWRFIFFYCGLIGLWMALNTVDVLLRLFNGKPFDEPPYQGLNLVLGIIATLQAPFIMMSQNREQARERLKSDADFKVNLKNEVAIEKALERLEELKRQIPELRRQVKEQEIALRKTGEIVAGAFAGGAGAAAAPTAPVAPAPAPLPASEPAPAPPPETPSRRWTRGVLKGK
jgi:uncharacterized membrane protein